MMRLFVLQINSRSGKVNNTELDFSTENKTSENQGRLCMFSRDSYKCPNASVNSVQPLTSYEGCIFRHDRLSNASTHTHYMTNRQWRDVCSLNILCILNERGIPEGVTYFSHFWFQKKKDKRRKVIVLTLIIQINLVDFHESRWEEIPYNVIPAPRFRKQSTQATTECNRRL
jgi:hypothetical protein